MFLVERLAEDPSVRGMAFNFSNGIEVTVMDLVHAILARMDSSLEPDVRGEATNEIHHHYLSADRARQNRAWPPLFTLEQGLNRTVAWYRDFFGQS